LLFYGPELQQINVGRSELKKEVLSKLYQQEWQCCVVERCNFTAMSGRL